MPAVKDPSTPVADPTAADPDGVVPGPDRPPAPHPNPSRTPIPISWNPAIIRSGSHGHIFDLGRWWRLGRHLSRRLLCWRRLRRVGVSRCRLRRLPIRGRRNHGSRRRLVKCLSSVLRWRLAGDLRPVHRYVFDPTLDTTCGEHNSAGRQDDCCQRGDDSELGSFHSALLDISPRKFIQNVMKQCQPNGVKSRKLCVLPLSLGKGRGEGFL